MFALDSKASKHTESSEFACLVPHHVDTHTQLKRQMESVNPCKPTCANMAPGGPAHDGRMGAPFLTLTQLAFPLGWECCLRNRMEESRKDQLGKQGSEWYGPRSQQWCSESSREWEKEEKGHSPATPDIGRKQEDQINPRAERTH